MGEEMKKNVIDGGGMPRSPWTSFFTGIITTSCNGRIPRWGTENTVLFFGRIWGYKGLEYLVEAEPILRKEVPGARSSSPAREREIFAERKEKGGSSRSGFNSSTSISRTAWSHVCTSRRRWWFCRTSTGRKAVRSCLPMPSVNR